MFVGVLRRRNSFGPEGGETKGRVGSKRRLVDVHEDAIFGAFVLRILGVDFKVSQLR